MRALRVVGSLESTHSSVTQHVIGQSGTASNTCTQQRLDSMAHVLEITQETASAGHVLVGLRSCQKTLQQPWYSGFQGISYFTSAVQGVNMSRKAQISAFPLIRISHIGMQVHTHACTHTHVR